MSDPQPCGCGHHKALELAERKLADTEVYIDGLCAGYEARIRELEELVVQLQVEIEEG